MFCSKCGKEIMDEAVVCPNCGCPTNNYTAQQSSQQTTRIHSNDYIAIKKYAQESRTLRNLTICSLILMFGIGFIFSIIVMLKLPKVVAPEITTTNPPEIVEFETAKRHYNFASRAGGIALAVFVACLIIGIFGALV